MRLVYCMNISMRFRYALPALSEKNGRASPPFPDRPVHRSFRGRLLGKVCALTTATAGDVRPLIFYKGSYQKIERDYDPNTPSDFYYLLNGW